MAMPLNLKSNIKDMQVGDAIACRYTASSNGVGVFSELGTCTANEIPVGGSSSPDGLFYFIHVGYDHKGRKKLVADRNIQHSISWDTLNAMGIAHGVNVNLESKLPVAMFPMTEGTGSTLNDIRKQVTGTITGATWIDTPYGKGLSFNSSRYVRFSSSVIPLGKKSIRFKMYRASVPSDYEHILSNTGDLSTTYGLNIYLNPTGSTVPGSIQVKFSDPSVSPVNFINVESGINVCDGKWHDILFTWDGTTDENAVKLYVDNMTTPVAQTTATHPETKQASQNLVISGRGDYSTAYGRYNGQLTRLEIYDDVIDFSEEKFYLSYMRLLEGGISSIDKDNEWDYIIVSSNLNGKIAPGDDNIWHWNANVRSWTSTVATSDATQRVMRGGTGFASNNGVNAFVEAASGDSQAYGGFRPVLIEALNPQPTTTTIIDKKVVYSETPHIIGEIIDKNKDDPISYRVLVNGEVYLDWTTPAFSPVQVNVPLILDVGINTITFEYTDGFNEVQSWTDTVIQKEIDSFYEDGLGLVKNTASLLIGGGSVAYLKIPASSGYLKNALLALNILEGSAGTIKIAPITSDWDSAEIESPPSVDTTKEIELEYNGTSGEVVFEFLMVTTYGIAIYSEDTELVIGVLNNTVEYEYWATILNQPNEVTMDLVPLTWNPLIMLEGAEYQKTVVVRATSNTFDNKTVVAELTNPNAIQYIDTDVGTGNYFYMIEVHYDITIQYSNVIEAPVPAAGFRNVLVNGEYQLKLRQGIAFDSTDVDYNFYTTPDGIKLRPLSIGNLTGGQNSDIHAFELINGYDDLNFDVTLFIYHFGAECDHDETYAYIGNADREGSVTKIGMSFTDNPFTPEYPLQFELEQGGRRIIYIKMFTAKVLTEPSTFQVTLLAYPKSYGDDNADGNTEII